GCVGGPQGTGSDGESADQNCGQFLIHFFLLHGIACDHSGATGRLPLRAWMQQRRYFVNELPGYPCQYKGHARPFLGNLS
ncbi:MAG: hypothetical protein VX168_06120, partial [Pseudomonadota bacterium]|nr:hypothetical protein [Pseudomonadota bacterium]